MTEQTQTTPAHLFDNGVEVRYVSGVVQMFRADGTEIASVEEQRVYAQRMIDEINAKVDKARTDASVREELHPAEIFLDFNIRATEHDSGGKIDPLLIISALLASKARTLDEDIARARAHIKKGYYEGPAPGGYRYGTETNEVMSDTPTSTEDGILISAEVASKLNFTQFDPTKPLRVEDIEKLRQSLFEGVTFKDKDGKVHEMGSLGYMDVVNMISDVQGDVTPPKLDWDGLKDRMGKIDHSPMLAQIGNEPGAFAYVPPGKGVRAYVLDDEVSRTYAHNIVPVTISVPAQEGDAVLPPMKRPEPPAMQLHADLLGVNMMDPFAGHTHGPRDAMINREASALYQWFNAEKIPTMSQEMVDWYVAQIPAMQLDKELQENFFKRLAKLYNEDFEKIRVGNRTSDDAGIWRYLLSEKEQGALSETQDEIFNAIVELTVDELGKRPVKPVRVAHLHGGSSLGSRSRMGRMATAASVAALLMAQENLPPEEKAKAQERSDKKQALLKQLIQAFACEDRKVKKLQYKAFEKKHFGPIMGSEMRVPKGIWYGQEGGTATGEAVIRWIYALTQSRNLYALARLLGGNQSDVFGQETWTYNKMDALVIQVLWRLIENLPDHVEFEGDLTADDRLAIMVKGTDGVCELLNRPKGR